MAFGIETVSRVARLTVQFAGRRANGLAHLILRNRVAIGLASLAWLILRSGAQPRRLSYPCQRAAAANVGGWAIALVPGAFIHRRRAAHEAPSPFARRAVVVGQTLFVASALFLVTLVGVRAYDYYAEGAAATDASMTYQAASDPSTPTAVAIVKSKTVPVPANYIEPMVREVVAKAGGLPDVSGKRVVIKPNLVVFDSNTGNGNACAPGEGVNTDWRVVKVIVDMCKEGGALSVKIADGTASDFNWTHFDRDATWHAFYNSGYDTNWDGWFDADPTVKLVDLNDASLGSSTWPPCDTTEPFTVCDNTNIVPPRSIDTNKVALITLPNGVLRTQYWVPKALLRPDQGGDCDVLITVPTFKNHGNAAATLALKNRVGCAPSDIYYYVGYQPNLKFGLVHSVSMGFPRNVSGDVPPATTDENALVNYSIVDLNLVRPQDFVVVDGLIGITNGPVGDGGAYNKCSPHMAIFMAARDSVANDTIGSLCMGYDPTQMAYMYWADRRNLGTWNTAWIDVEGSYYPPAPGDARMSVASVRRVFPARGGSIAAETTSPVISALSLKAGWTYWGTVDVVGSGVSDNRGVKKVELLVDGVPVATNRVAPVSAAFSWDSTQVADGPHTIKMTVYDAALNEASLTVANVWIANNNTGMRTDFGHDNDTDLDDFSLFQSCFNGPNRAPTVYCNANADFDADGDVDLTDFGIFQQCFNGPNRPYGC